MGEIDLATVDTLRAALDAVLRSGERDVWIDLTHVTFMDATGLHALLDTHRPLDADQRQLAVIVAPGIITRMMEETGLDQIHHAPRPPKREPRDLTSP